jgi:photosystem II stability/assembly factor-like uncharacterized protein
MPTNPAIFSNSDSRTWVQDGGVGTAFELYACHALTNWSQDFGEPTYIRCKSPDEYGKKVIKESIPGEAGAPTFTVIAWTSQEADFLVSLKDTGCEVDWQVFFGACSSPSDATGYTKIRHFYRASLTSLGEENVDGLDEDVAGVQLTGEFSCEEVIEILKMTVTRQNNGVTETQGFNDIAFVTTTRCEGDCGAEVTACKWGVAVADSNYGSATANVWYTNDSGATWTLCATDPFASNSANLSSCVIIAKEVAPRFIVFRGNVFSDYGARCSISDDWGASWSEVDMGGHANGSYVNGAFLYSAGMIWAVGNGGHIYYSMDQGAAWTLIADATTGVVVELWDIHTPDNDTVYVVGDANTCIKSSDGGASWAATSDASPAASAVNLYTVQAPTKYRVIVGGELDTSSDVMWISVDGGAVWNDVDFTGSTTASGAVRRIRCAPKAPEQHWVFAHGVESVTTRYGAGTDFRFFRTLDGGGSFERMNLVSNNGLNGLSVCSINRAWACGEVSAAGTADIQRMAAA